MQVLQQKGVAPDCVLQDYDLILIPEWVLTEIKDSAISALYDCALSVKNVSLS